MELLSCLISVVNWRLDDAEGTIGFFYWRAARWDKAALLDSEGWTKHTAGGNKLSGTAWAEANVMDRLDSTDGCY